MDSREAVFPGESVMARRLRAFDWTRTPLGNPETWPTNLKVVLGVCLTSRVPMHVWWGPSLTLFYNDACRSLLGSSKHRAAIGGSAREAWADIWDVIAPTVHCAFTEGVASSVEDVRMSLNGDAPKEKTSVTFSFSPVFGEDGEVDGIFCSCIETAEQVVGREPTAESAALRQTNVALAQRVREGTDELQQANAMLKALFKRLVSAQDEERRRIAREIHDQLGQQMTALRMNIETLPGGDGVTRVLELAEELDRTIDFLTRELRPAALDDLGLFPALQHVVSEWSERHHIAAECVGASTAELSLDADVDATLYYIVQEALHNVAKHAAATRVTVALGRRDDQIVLVVEDNGCGFDPAIVRPTSSSGLGLIGMRERAALVGGTIDFDSIPGRGTAVFVRVPVRAPSQAAN